MTKLKPLHWIASSKSDPKAFPTDVRRAMGFALWQAQSGLRHFDSKPLRGFGGAGVLEIVEDFDGNAFRVVYTVRFAEAVYVLHAFQKKAKQGDKTPKHEINLIKSRLKMAKELYETWQQTRSKIEEKQGGDDSGRA